MSKKEIEKVNKKEIVKISNPFLPQKKEIIYIDLKKDNLSCIKDKFFPNNIDVEIIVNGLIIPEAFWDGYKIKKNDFIQVQTIIGKGETEKMIMNIAIMIVIGVYAAPIGVALAGGTAAVAAGGTAAFISAVAYAAIMTGAGMLVNSLTPKPSSQSFDIEDTER